MSTSNVQLARDLLFGKDGLCAANFKVFPGHARDTTSEAMAGEIVTAVRQLKAGDFDLVANVGE